MRGRVIAAIANDRNEGSGTAHLEVFTPNLVPVGAPILPLPSHRITRRACGRAKASSSYDGNGDGTPETTTPR